MNARWTMRAPLTARWRLALLAAAATVLAGAALAYGRTSGPGSIAEQAIEPDAGFAMSRGEAIGAPPAGKAMPAGVPFPADGVFAPSASVVGASPLPPGADALDLLGRQIIRNGSIDMEVESVAGAFERVSAIASAAGGFVADSSFFGREEQQTAQMMLRIPAERFDAVVNELRSVAAEVKSISTSSQDVTGELTDLQSALRNLRAVEGQYLTLLERAGSIGEVLQVQDRLNQTRAQIDRTEGRIQLLERLADLATLSVSLRPVAAPAAVDATGGGPLGAAQEAWEASLGTLTAIATVVLVVVVYSWWLLPVILVAALVGRRFAAALAAGRPPRTAA